MQIRSVLELLFSFQTLCFHTKTVKSRNRAQQTGMSFSKPSSSSQKKRGNTFRQPSSNPLALGSPVRVVVRVRPLTTLETERGKQIHFTLSIFILSVILLLQDLLQVSVSLVLTRFKSQRKMAQLPSVLSLIMSSIHPLLKKLSFKILLFRGC